MSDYKTVNYLTINESSKQQEIINNLYISMCIHKIYHYWNLL